MSTTSIQAVAAGVIQTSRDPVTTQFIAQLADLLKAWFLKENYVIEEVELYGDYMLNGNLGKRAAFFQLTNPDGGRPLRVVCELRTFAKDETLCGFLRVRQNGQGPNPWENQDSTEVEVHYPSHPGEYKLQLLMQQLRTQLNVNEGTNQLEGTQVLSLLQAAMAEAKASAIA